MNYLCFQSSMELRSEQGCREVCSALSRIGLVGTDVSCTQIFDDRICSMLVFGSIMMKLTPSCFLSFTIKGLDSAVRDYLCASYLYCCSDFVTKEACFCTDRDHQQCFHILCRKTQWLCAIRLVC